MATIDDIIEARDAATKQLTAQIRDGVKKAANESASPKRKKLLDEVDRLRELRNQVAIQAYMRAMDSPELKASLDAIRAATKAMKEVAKKMQTVTGYINNAANLLGAGEKVVAALKPAK